MRNNVRLSLIVSLLVASSVFLTPVQAQPYYYRWASVPAASCLDMGGSVQITIPNVYVEWDLPVGNEWTITFNLNGSSYTEGPFSWPPGTGSQGYGASTETISGPYPVFYSEQLDTFVDGVLVYRSTYTVNCSADGPATVTLVNEEITSGDPGPGTGPGAGLEPIVVPVPGPDMVAIPDGAVVGTFTTSTPLYFQPEASSASTYSMGAGQSLWVFGLDESGEFYQVLLSGKTYWVPVETMGPTFDAVWQGHPLPANTVE